MEILATVEKIGPACFPWKVRIKKSETHGVVGGIHGCWKTKKKAQAFADNFNKAAHEWKK